MGENWRASDPIGPGIGQGDAISYVFVLCMERLGHLINDSINSGQWKPIRLSRNGPLLSHLFFVDDLILFGEASTEQMDVIKPRVQKIGRVRYDSVNS